MDRGGGIGRLGRIGRSVAPLLIPFVPKCPMCLLPLFAAAGIALPPRPLLDGLVAVTAAVWVATVLSSARWLPVRVAALAAAILLLGGRALETAWVGGIGAALVLAVVFWTRRRPRACGAAACLGTSSEFPSTKGA
jgi:hypothetical protein